MDLLTLIYLWRKKLCLRQAKVPLLFPFIIFLTQEKCIYLNLEQKILPAVAQIQLVFRYTIFNKKMDFLTIVYKWSKKLCLRRAQAQLQSFHVQFPLDRTNPVANFSYKCSKKFRLRRARIVLVLIPYSFFFLQRKNVFD